MSAEQPASTPAQNYAEMLGHLFETSEAGRKAATSPVGDVFSFYRDFRNLPAFLGDVMAIEPVGPVTSRWTVQGPLGIRVRRTVKITEERKNELIRFETVTG